MDLKELEINANKINEYSKSLIRQYKIIVNSLLRIKGIVIKSNDAQAREIQTLIDNYNRVILMIDEYYVKSANHLLAYVDATKENVYQLSVDLKNTKLYDDLF